MDTIERKCSYCDGRGQTGSNDEPSQCQKCGGSGVETFGTLLTGDMVSRLNEISDNTKTIIELCEKILANKT